MKRYYIPVLTALTVAVLFSACSSSKKSQALHSAPAAATKNKKNKQAATYTLSNIGNRPFLGIGLIVDSATSLSRSFAFYELFKNNLLTKKADTLFPVLVDYPFNAPYAVTGISTERVFKLKLYKNGKKVSEITALKDWKDVYSKIAREFTGNSFTVPKLKSVNEGVTDNVDGRKIKECLPGSIQTSVPYNKLVDTLRRYVNMSYYYSSLPYDDCKDLYGKYATYNENKLFFFRSFDVPYNLRSAVRPLVFPLYKSLAPALTYLSSGKRLADNRDYGGSLNCFYSALNASNNILASPFERAFVRTLAFEQIAKVHTLVSSNRVYSTQIFQLAADLNHAYVNSSDARTQRKEYYENIKEIEVLCTKAEDKAKEIRGQKRLGGFLAAVSYAGALSTTSAYDNTTSNAFMSEAETYFTTSQQQASEVSKALLDQFEKIEDKIDARSFIASDGSKIEIGKSYVADEVYYYLSINPELVKNILLPFAQDKPKLKELLNRYYSSKDKSVLNDIYLSVAEMEARILNAEVRNIPVGPAILKTF
jgi:hypothetical protein